MPSYAKPLRKLEYSPDGLSDTTPTYSDITSPYLIDLSWHGGKANLRDEPRPGGGTILLKNLNRDFEPGYSGARFAVDIGHRFRLYLDRGSGWEQQFLLYALDYEIDYPADTDYSVVTVTLGDGDAILESLEQLDPADASSYEEVVNFDEPSFYYRLGESAGTKMVSHLRSRRWRREHPHRKRRYRTRETREELGGVSGPSGTYKNTPTLGEPGLILGDSDTGVLFTESSNEYGRVGPLDQSDAIDLNSLTLECWYKPSTVVGFAGLIAGPNKAGATGGATDVFHLKADDDNLGFGFVATDNLIYGFTTAANLVVGVVTYIACVWDGEKVFFYENGLLIHDEFFRGKVIAQGDANEFLKIGRMTVAGTTSYADGVIDEPAIYEKALSAERILAHYQAGAQRGFAAQLAGDRIEALATSSLWGETRIQAGSHTVVPRMKYGQARMDEIKDAVLAEQPYSNYFRANDGDPVYLGWEYKGGGTYMTSQATFGPSNVPYDGVELDFDTEFYNDVTVSREDGPSQNVTDSASIAARLRHALEETIMVTEDSSALSVAGALLSEFRKPELRPVSLAVNHANALPQIMDLEIGERIRVKGPSVDPWDRVTHILGFSKALSRDGILTCTWNLSRGFDAVAGQWRAGVTGFSEASTSTVAG